MSILMVGLLCFNLQTACGQSLPTCPIGTDGAPNLIDPGIASGAQCRGACGEDCPSDRCDPVAHITIPIYDASGQQYNCVYNNVVRCLTHQGCQDHDACYDKCAEPISSGGAGETSIYGSCHQKCNSECFNKWGYAQCGAWSDLAGYVGDYWVNPDFGGYLLFSDPPKLVGPIGDQGGKTGGDNQGNKSSMISPTVLAVVFPADPFNGLQVSYSVSGATLGSPTDSEGFTVSRSIKGTLDGDELTVSGVATATNGWGATIDVSVSVDGENAKKFHEEKFPEGGLYPNPMSQPFTVTVPLPTDAKSVNFAIDLTGSYNAGSRSVVVDGYFDRSPLSELTDLETLGLNSTQITDVSPLSGLTNLEIIR